MPGQKFYNSGYWKVVENLGEGEDFNYQYAID